LPLWQVHTIRTTAIKEMPLRYDFIVLFQN